MFKLQHISIETKDGREVVHDVSLALESGKVHLLMGPNGSGKSTLLNAVLGHPLYKLTKGNIYLGEENITSLKTEEKAKKGIFLSMQHIPEIPGVTMTNFLHRAHRALTGEAVSIPEFYGTLKTLAERLGIDPQFIRRELNTGFSGGEKKQSEVLQMLTLKPKVALLDEIDSGVDVDALKRIILAVEELAKGGSAVLLVTHYSKLLELVHPEKVFVMANGKMVAEGGKALAEEIAVKGFAHLSGDSGDTKEIDS